MNLRVNFSLVSRVLLLGAIFGLGHASSAAGQDPVDPAAEKPVWQLSRDWKLGSLYSNDAGSSTYTVKVELPFEDEFIIQDVSASCDCTIVSLKPGDKFLPKAAMDIEVKLTHPVSRDMLEKNFSSEIMILGTSGGEKKIFKFLMSGSVKPLVHAVNGFPKISMDDGKLGKFVAGTPLVKVNREDTLVAVSLTPGFEVFLQPVDGSKRVDEVNRLQLVTKLDRPTIMRDRPQALEVEFLLNGEIYTVISVPVQYSVGYQLLTKKPIELNSSTKEFLLRVYLDPELRPRNDLKALVQLKTPMEVIDVPTIVEYPNESRVYVVVKADFDKVPIEKLRNGIEKVTFTFLGEENVAEVPFEFNWTEHKNE